VTLVCRVVACVVLLIMGCCLWVYVVDFEWCLLIIMVRCSLVLDLCSIIVLVCMFVGFDSLGLLAGFVCFGCCVC